MSATVSAEMICSNPDCRVSVDKKCVEGLTFDKCQFFGKPPADLQPSDGGNTDAAAGIDLDPGAPLHALQASGVLRASRSRVIGIIGAYDCGKTSLMAGLYDLFQEGPIGGVTFAGSSTLHGFEKICHDSRVASKRGTAHSARTSRGEVTFYHLDVQRDGEADIVSLLLADRSGEEYEEVADDMANGHSMSELRRADTVTVLVDGRRLCDPKSRHDVINSVAPIVQGLQESGAFARRPQLAVVLTKNDALVASDKADVATADFDRLVETMERRFSERFSVIRKFVTTASPTGMAVKRGDGLQDLLLYWLNESPPEAAPAPVPISNDRVFANLRAREA
ncbi:TRAFAC clade GTPase domain-containing protein [Bradyrhizobium sp. AZCC 1693]|uniref:TRAFAC clade GTPase domain-containing protein n=1 Tax=Bradyrhizobium sp. AZCC 1693 TaxID=3117029 RepID=UPI002FEE71BA